MNYFGDDELTQVMGIGYLGEVRRGPDGSLYQWVQGVDGLGNPFGFWKKIKKIARSVAKPIVSVAKKAVQFVKKPYCIPLQAIPGPVKGITRRVCGVVRKLRPLADVPVVGSYYRGINRLCSVARDCGIAGLESGLMQTPDGTLYQVEGLADEELYGLAEDEELMGLGQDETEMMGIGYSGEIGQGPDGNLYQWVEGVDGMGSPVGFWGEVSRPRLRRWRRCRCRRRRLSIPRAGMRAPGIPASAPGSRTLTHSLQPVAVSGYERLGALYQAPDGTLYQMTDIGQEDEMGYLTDDEELQGLDQDDEMGQYGEDEDLQGFGQEDDMGYLAEDELDGYGADDDLYGLDEDDLDGMNGYVREGINGLDAFIPDKPAGTRMFERPAQTPDIWRSLW